MSETELEAAQRDAEASTTALAVSISEAAEQEVAARSAAEAHRRFVELVQGLDAIVWEMDAVTWKFTFVSDRAQDILGYPISQWLNEPTFWQDCLLHPEDRDWCVNFCVSATNQAKDHEFQYRAIASDGRVVWLKDVVRVVCDEQGCPKLLRGVMVDITKEKEAEEKTQLLLREQAARIEVETVQEALRKSEERYRSLVEATAQIIWDTKAEGEFVTPQPGWSAFTGQSYEQLKGWGWLNAVHPDDQAHTVQEWLNAVANGTLYQIEHRLRRSDGIYKYMSVRAVPVFEADGSIREWIGVHTDISDRKSAEEALKQSEHRYAQILDSVQDMVFCKAPGSVVVYANKAACEYYGMTLEQLHGITDVPYNQLDYTQQYLQDDLQVFTTGQPIEVLEEPNVRADGETRFFHTIKSPIFDTNGNVVEIVGVSRDISERKQEREIRDRALAEAQAARAELQRVFMQAPAAIAITRGSNHVTETVNPLYMQIVEKRDIVGKPVREAFWDLQGQGFFELLDQVYTSGEPFVGNEMRAMFDRNSDGILEESFWNFVYQPLVDANGKVNGIMTHAVEVTEQVRSRQEIEKKAEELVQMTQALERSNRDLDQFAYIASHDLKAPLRAIATLSEWIEEDLADKLTEDSREHLNLLRGRVHRMEALINGILQYSRAGRVQQQIETVNVSSLLSEVIELLDPPPEVAIVVPNMPTLQTERVPLQQVFMNLIGNAIKYANRSDMCIQVGVRELGKYYEFSVADNGQGIEPKYHQKIWGIFQRLEARDKVEGTGIGLSVVKKIVESRGGRVWLESAAGTGATFRFTWAK
ncbi:PAS domain-containing sensor histidine kinase [Coleofasciculus sp. FACHB-1120]|uniref:PAS domain-containing sensor histidine kinase n=1 Tax=Coleofasciculus sp. FACHB-1120 TaxID=2692783 RepID=UPI001683E933|nr:PAS domain-containing sensor histidine kinase [Coleofasciculus sp. FACHB-1120]MBD2740635.1 PAS domain S-box protein [Coleofasciculus sp. FACHB-1120]